MAQNRYLYNGKELQDQAIGGTPFGWYDYGARFYDAEIARWHTPDPLVDLHQDYTPYHYCFNNPVSFIDPYGLDTVRINPNNWPNFDPNKDVGKIDEVVVTAKRPTNGSSSSSYDGSMVATSARTDKRKYIRGTVRPIDYTPTIGVTKFDCSGYALYRLGSMGSQYKLLAALLGTSTASILHYAKLHGGIHQKPKVGDFALWIGHVEVVTSVNGDNFDTMGSSGRDGNPVPTPKSFSGTDDSDLKYYGKGVFVGFWTPQLPKRSISLPPNN